MATFEEIITSRAERDAVERTLRSAGITHAVIGDDDDRAYVYFAVARSEFDAVDRNQLSQDLTVCVPGRKAEVTYILGQGTWQPVF
jgi:hypothetical protein